MSSPQNEEIQVLLQNMKSAESNSFISARTRDGLVTPCNDLVGILEEVEVLFRNEVTKSKLVLRNIRMLGFVIQVIIYILRPNQERLRKIQHKVTINTFTSMFFISGSPREQTCILELR
jgi:hypothetical protein